MPTSLVNANRLTYSKTLTFRCFLILGILAVKSKACVNINPPTLYAECNLAAGKNGEPDEYLRYVLYCP